MHRRWNLCPYPSMVHSLIKWISSLYLVKNCGSSWHVSVPAQRALYSALKCQRDFSVCKTSHRWKDPLGQQLQINTLITDQVYELWKILKEKVDTEQNTKESLGVKRCMYIQNTITFDVKKMPKIGVLPEDQLPVSESSVCLFQCLWTAGNTDNHVE